MRFLKLTALLGLVCGARAQSECIAPVASTGPLPPVLPGSFHMVYEKTDQLNNVTSFYDVWYDWKNQRARVDEVAQDKGKTLLFDFGSAAGFEYETPKPGQDESKDEQILPCQYLPIKIGSPDLYYFNAEEKPVRMVDVYHALLFGGPFRYAYVGEVLNETTRFIKTNKFESCVHDASIAQDLKIAYYWSLEDSQERPIRCEREGQDVKELLSIIRFHRNPEFPRDIFSIPRYMDCSGMPASTVLKDLPSVADDSAWREERFSYSRDDSGKVYGVVKDSYREIWIADQYKLARMDWTPTRAQVGTFLRGLEDKPLSIIADMSYGALFITNKNNGECVVRPLTEEFPLSRKVKDKFVLRTAADLLGMDGPRVLKGEYLERGNPVLVYSSKFDINMNEDKTTLHETTLRFDVQLAVDSYGAYEFVPVSQLTRVLATDPDNVLTAKTSFEQIDYYRYKSQYHPMHVYSAPGCVVHHKRRNFELRFAGEALGVIGDRSNAFLDELRYQIHLRGDFETVMRIEELDLFEDTDPTTSEATVVVRMTILEPLEEIVSKRTVTVDEAVRKIVEVVDDGNFAVPFDFDDGEHLLALECSFKEITPGRRTVLLKRSERETVEKAVAEVGPGYSLGTFIGVCVGAFFVGIALGVLIVFLKTRTSTTSTTDGGDVPLGDIEQNQGEADLNQPGPSGWKQNQVDSLDE